VMVGIIALSIFALSPFALIHAPTPPPITLPTATATPTPIVQPTAIPNPTSSQIPNPTAIPTSSPTASPTPTPPTLAMAWTTDFPVGTALSSIIQTDDGGYVAIGSVALDPGSNLMWNGWMAKVDGYGKILWSKAYGDNTTNTVVKEGIKTSDGGFALAGYSGNNVWLGKTDPMGNMTWNQTYNSISAGAYSIIQMNDNGYLLQRPNIQRDANGSWAGSSITLIRVDVLGNLQWTKYFTNCIANSITKASDGGAFLAGGTELTGTLVKIDSEGKIQWNKTYNDPVFNQIMATSDGGFLLTSCADPLFWLIKTDSAGKEQWTNSYNNVSSGRVTQTNGGYIIAGYFGDRAPGVHPSYYVIYRLMIKTDLNGNLQWEKSFDIANENTDITINGIITISNDSYLLFSKGIKISPWYGYGVIFKITIIPTT